MSVRETDNGTASTPAQALSPRNPFGSPVEAARSLADRAPGSKSGAVDGIAGLESAMAAAGAENASRKPLDHLARHALERARSTLLEATLTLDNMLADGASTVAHHKSLNVMLTSAAGLITDSR